jgi:hypothetical protein
MTPAAEDASKQGCGGGRRVDSPYPANFIMDMGSGLDVVDAMLMILSYSPKS